MRGRAGPVKIAAMNFPLSTRHLIAAVLFAPMAVSACEPILPMIVLYGGPGIAARSLVWLAIAVVVKCLAFMLFETRASRSHAFLAMFVGNVLSTIAGFLLVCAFSGSLVPLLIFVPLVCLYARAPGRRIHQAAPWEWARKFGPGDFAGLLIVALFASLFLFGMADFAIESRNYWLYWVSKSAYVALGLGVSLAITSAFEEWGCHLWLRNLLPESAFYKAVLRSNYIVFGLIFLVLALKALPKRLNSPNFLIDQFAFLAWLL